jgi:putative ABC transport system ATP-binding protein
MTAFDLSMRDLAVTGDGGRVLLRVDGLDIAAGARVGVRGPSGAGKSTLLHAMAGLLRPAAGSVRWGGTDIAVLGDAARAEFRRRSVGLVFQDFLLFEELSALGNAAIAGSWSMPARRGAIARGAAGMLEHLGLSGHARRPVASFSGGERQRVAVSRALAGDPPIILADEPTASLDRASADRLIDDLVRISREQGKTLVAVSHDAALHARMDRVIDVVDGALREGA